VDVPIVPPRSAVSELSTLLDSPEIQTLVTELEATRWTGRPGYPIRAMVGVALVKSMYALPTWSRTVRLVAEHAALRDALGAIPSQWACYRFAAKLREHSAALADCLDRVTASLHKLLPGLGESVALDGSDLPAYANGQRYVRKGGPERERYADPDASWGHRSAISTRKGGGFYGYKVHAAVCTKTALPLAWSVETAREVEQTFAAPLLAQLHTRGFRPLTAAMDSAYDVGHVHDAFEAGGCHPIAKLRKTPGVLKGAHKPTMCEHGTWTFAGSDFKRGASKWRCPTGECKPASRWVKADRLHPLIPRETKRWGKLYAQRSAVEREFGRLKHEWALLPLRVRGIERVRLHADLTILAKLACTLSRARAVVAERAERRAALLATAAA
jgi:hypothetical protein